MSRIGSTLVLAGAIAFGLAFAAGAPDARAQDVVKIAAGGPLTGALAKQGQEVANAVKLAVADWNKKGGVLGKKIEVVDADDQGNPQIGVAAAEKVAADPAVMGAVWGITSVTCIPASEVLDRANIVLIVDGEATRRCRAERTHARRRRAVRTDRLHPGLGGAAEGNYVTFLVPDINKLPSAAPFLKEFQAEYGPLSSYGPLAYEGTNILLTAIQKVGKIDRAAIAAEVRATTNYNGILGFPITFDDKGDVKGAQVYVYQVKGDHFEQLGAVTLPNS